ncbi:DUF7144 family membrane protein [Nocardioides bizhenqiangii]|uniref:DUF7144 domain-containing protein n=1 Tax=Nocardioides bizhenqiangii TaxID=3095076 RepID=A0ABZ0ZWP7_9ACTN|nr:hypothetical protein [Nocardioides sp. HM61]WQQ28259.1 hypothetical protein SHK19_08495 [Nocardioides sp. HM61]
MTEQTTSQQRSDGEPPNSWAVGFTAFAGVMMIMAGGFQTFAGIAALAKDEFYVATPNYILEFDATEWGWIHLLLGLLVLFAGFAVLSGQMWGRVVAIILAVLSALANFAFIPYYPFWAITVIALDVFIIWALSAHGRDIVR